MGGLVISLGCLFTSFATEFHQVYISYGLIMSTGISMAQNSFMLMLGQYFKKRRELVEIFVVSGTGGGLMVVSAVLNYFVREGLICSTSDVLIYMSLIEQLPYTPNTLVKLKVN